jgi:hypothetical protein
MRFSVAAVGHPKGEKSRDISLLLDLEYSPVLLSFSILRSQVSGLVFNLGRRDEEVLA